MVVLKELILNSFYIQNRFLYPEGGDLKRTDFEQFLYCKCVEVLKDLIFNSFYIQKVWWSWQKWFCDRLDSDFEQFLYCRGCGGLERTDFYSFYIQKGMVVLKELIFHSFYYSEGMVVLKELILNSFYIHIYMVMVALTELWTVSIWFLTVSILGGSGGLERTDF